MISGKSSPALLAISSGGLFNDIITRLGLHEKRASIPLFIMLITWLPLLVLSLFEKTAWSGADLPFIYDIPTQFRFLLGLPLYLSIGMVIDGKGIDLQNYFSNTLMPDKQQQAVLAHILQKARKMSASYLSEIIMILVIIGGLAGQYRGDLFDGLPKGITSWIAEDKNNGNLLSFAGYWYTYLSIPCYQFFFLRWIWRYVIWVWLLFRLSRSRLSLQYTHSDQSGGLSIILYAQRYFSSIFVAANIVVSGELIRRLIDHPESFSAIIGEVYGFVIIGLIIILLPFLFFSGVLIKIKNKGLLELNGLGESISHKFETEWVNERSIEEKLSRSTVSTSTLQDYSTIYSSMANMRTVPLSSKDLIAFALMLFIPFSPLLLIHFSMGELFQKLIEMIL